MHRSSIPVIPPTPFPKVPVTTFVEVEAALPKDGSAYVLVLDIDKTCCSGRVESGGLGSFGSCGDFGDFGAATEVYFPHVDWETLHRLVTIAPHVLFVTSCWHRYMRLAAEKITDVLRIDASLAAGHFGDTDMSPYKGAKIHSMMVARGIPLDTPVFVVDDMEEVLDTITPDLVPAATLFRMSGEFLTTPLPTNVPKAPMPMAYPGVWKAEEALRVAEMKAKYRDHAADSSSE